MITTASTKQQLLREIHRESGEFDHLQAWLQRVDNYEVVTQNADDENELRAAGDDDDVSYADDFNYAAERLYERNLDDFAVRFRNIADEDDDGQMLVYRMVGVRDVDAFIAAVAAGTPPPGYNGLGIFWSWSIDGAVAYENQHRASGTELLLEGSVDLDAINLTRTLVLNSSSGTYTEMEITLNERAPVRLLRVMDDRGKELWRAPEDDYPHMMVAEAEHAAEDETAAAAAAQHYHQNGIELVLANHDKRLQQRLAAARIQLMKNIYATNEPTAADILDILRVIDFAVSPRSNFDVWVLFDNNAVIPGIKNRVPLPIGNASVLTGDVAVIENVEIEPHHRGVGIGQFLYRSLAAHYGAIRSGSVSTSEDAERVWRKLGAVQLEDANENGQRRWELRADIASADLATAAGNLYNRLQYVAKHYPQQLFNVVSVVIAQEVEPDTSAALAELMRTAGAAALQVPEVEKRLKKSRYPHADRVVWLAQQLARLPEDDRLDDLMTKLEDGGFDDLCTWMKSTPSAAKLSLPAALTGRDNDSSRLIPGEVIATLSDGWTVQLLKDPAAIRQEGRIMQHCLRHRDSEEFTDDEIGYNEYDEPRGDWVVYSVRDEKGQPHLTIDQHVHYNFIRQIVMKQNHRPQRGDVYYDRAVEAVAAIAHNDNYVLLTGMSLLRAAAGMKIVGRVDIEGVGVAVNCMENMGGGNYDGFNWGHVDFSRAKFHTDDADDELRLARFDNCNLKGVDLGGMQFSNCRFDGADLSGANLSDCRFYSCDLEGANLDGAKVSDATFSYCDMAGASVRGVDFSTVADISARSARDRYGTFSLRYDNTTVWNEDLKPPKKTGAK